MSFGNLFRPPRRLLVWFLALTLLPAFALTWSGWRLLKQDRILEQQRMQANRDAATGLIVTAFQQSIAASQQSLGEPAAWQRLALDGSFVVAFGPRTIETMPHGRLLYYPFQPALPEAAAELFEPARADENRQDYDGAIAQFRELALSSDPAIRAGADLGLARNLRREGLLTAALDVYTNLAALDGVAVAGNPADLVARRARCALLAELKRTDELKREAEKLYTDLQTSRWQLDFGAYKHFTEEVTPWLGRDHMPDVEEQSLAQAVNSLWHRWKETAGNPVTARGVEAAHIGSKSVTLVWIGTADRLTAFAASPVYVERTWLGSLDPLLKKLGVRVTLQDAEGAVSDTGLPWKLQIESLYPAADLAQATARQRLLLAGLVLVLAVVLAGSYFVGRAFTNELAVAQLQSEFVATVSHEFRTPLTSLRQSTEMLSDGRQSDPSRLPDYYQAQTRATERLQRLVETLLDFGRMEAGARPYRMQKLDVSEWLQSVVRDFQSGDAPGDCRLELQIQNADNRANTVNADPEALASALRNLIDNAVKYSPDCRTVWVELARRGECVALSVRDRGLGIPANERKQIFRMFVRGSACRTNGIKGTGIGLAMVQQIVSAHGGEVQLESKSGHGSTFTILLPESRN